MLTKTNSIASNTLSRRAMIVSLTISQWSGRRLDRQITDEVNTQHNAAADAGRYNKQLLDKSALAEIQKIVGQARTEFAGRTLPWVDDGSRIMSNHAHAAFVRWFAHIERSFNDKVSAFLSEYPAHVAEAKKRLNGMFRADDYPDVDELRCKFGIKISIMPVPTADDFRVAMSEAQADEIRADIERNVNEAVAGAVRDIYRRIHDVASRMVDRLNAYRPSEGKGDRAEGIFRDSLVTNVRDLIAILPGLNITGDPAIAAMVGKLQPLAEYDAHVLRDNPGKRADAAAAAQKILDDIGGMFA